MVKMVNKKFDYEISSDNVHFDHGKDFTSLTMRQFQSVMVMHYPLPPRRVYVSRLALGPQGWSWRHIGEICWGNWV